MMRRAWPAAVLFVLLSAHGAHASAIDRGTFALGAERITGVFHTDEKIGSNDNPGRTTIALFTNVPGGITGAWEVPRITFDYFVTNGLSIGGSFMVWNASQGNVDATHIVFGPRIGFGYMFTRVVGIWPRGGLSYWHGSGDVNVAVGNIAVLNGGESAHSFAFDLDVPLVIAPVRSFAILLGPLLDVGFAGELSGNNANTSVDTSFVQFGLSAGIAGLL